MGGGMMGGYMSRMMAYSLRQLIQESIDPESWFELSDLGEGTIMVFPDQQPKKLAVYQTPEVHAQIEDLLDQLRVALGYEVSIEARFLVVSENFLEDIGLDVDFSLDFGGKVGVVTIEQDSALSTAPTATKVPGSLGGLADTPAGEITGGYGSVLNDLQVGVLIRATQGRTDSTSLAAPKVTVLSGESAMFSLNNEITYALPPTQTQGTTIGTGGGGIQQQGTYQNVGLVFVGSNMSITPTIQKDKKHVLLNIMTYQMDLLGFRTHQVSQVVQGQGGAGQDVGELIEYPVTVPEREISNVATRVSVPDRGTLLLGGHKVTQEVDKEVGVPVLNKLPIVGRLFSNRSKIRDHKILLILVKPTIILQEETEQEAIAAMEEPGSAYPY
jgi:type II secretory pathway component GspD/PulD (secretin)